MIIFLNTERPTRCKDMVRRNLEISIQNWKENLNLEKINKIDKKLVESSKSFDVLNDIEHTNSIINIGEHGFIHP